MRKALFIIASRDFRDEEYFIPRDILISSDFEITTGGDKVGMAIGSDGGEVEIEIDIDEVKVREFDVLIFIGGSGCLKYLDNERSYKVIKEAYSMGVVLAAICISPIILAKAGVLKKATVWTGPMDNSAVKILENFGVVFENEDVVVDGKIITANGPSSAEEFGRAVDREVKKR